jgi:hypothetical protein
MTEIDIERCKEQAQALGYLRMIGKSNTFYYNKLGDNWFIEVTITNSSSNLSFYIVEASLSGKNTKYTKDFVTGYKDIFGPVHQWCKSLIAFNKFIEG